MLPPDAGRRVGGTLQGVEIVTLGWRLGLLLLPHVAIPEFPLLTSHPVLSSLSLPDTHLVAPLFSHSHQRQCYHSFAGTIVMFLELLLSQTASAYLGGEGREGEGARAISSGDLGPISCVVGPTCVLEAVPVLYMGCFRQLL